MVECIEYNFHIYVVLGIRKLDIFLIFFFELYTMSGTI